MDVEEGDALEIEFQVPVPRHPRCNTPPPLPPAIRHSTAAVLPPRCGAPSGVNSSRVTHTSPHHTRLAQLFNLFFQLTSPQVVTGGNLDVDFDIRDPAGKVIDTGSRRQDALYEGVANQKGSYQVIIYPPTLPKPALALVASGVVAEDSS